MKNQIKNKEREQWKKEFLARLINFSVKVLHFGNSINKDPVLRPVSDQLVRSATSVGANVCEAQGAGSKRDFAHFFQIALKSAKETQYWLLVVQQYGKDTAKTTPLLEEAKEITKIINSALLTMNGKK